MLSSSGARAHTYQGTSNEQSSCRKACDKGNCVLTSELCRNLFMVLLLSIDTGLEWMALMMAGLAA
jgi:hypothetical protein